MKTSKIILLLFGLCLVLPGVKAQTAKKFKPEMALGVSFGTTFSTVTFQPKVQTKMKMGYTAGLTYRWISEKNLGLQAELNFVQQGWSENYEEHPEYYYKRTINYIEIPFLTHIYFGSKKVRGFVNLGPKIGYAIGESTDENLNGAKPGRVDKQHGLSVEHKFDWGLCGGPGIEFVTGIGTFALEGRFFYALGDVFKSSKEDYFGKSSNQVISAKLTYLLPFGK